MHSKIVKLPSSVINQIAAGEVVENPASIVKELVENSLDAGAKNISVKISQGGQESILVEDDGAGMNEEEALLSIERHATSKIRVIEDMENLGSMGFRGEALAAIASVSKFEMITTDQEVGTKICIEGGKIIKKVPAARNRGTTIRVDSLFFNVPARKKFQKSVGSDAAAVRRVMEQLMLAHPDVHFQFNDQIFLPTTRELRIEEILGPFDLEVETNQIYAKIGSAQDISSTRKGQYVFVNQRPIFSPLISKAVKDAFATRISEHSFPKFVLFLKMDANGVDVNVHPQKKEVRFKDESKIYRSVFYAVEKAFAPKDIGLQNFEFTPTQESCFISESFPAFEYRASQEPIDWISQEKPLAIIGRFFLLEKDHLILMDLKAAHARILFESIRSEKKAFQTLLVPIQIPNQSEECVEALQKIGVEARMLQKTLVVDVIPAHLDADDFPQFFEEFINGKKLEQTLARFCSGRKKNFSLEQALRIYREVQKCNDTLFDPLGNPIAKKISEDDLKKWLSNL